MIPQPLIWSAVAIYLTSAQITVCQGPKIDAFNYKYCGRSNLRTWQQKESAFNCKSGRSFVTDDNISSSYTDRVVNGVDANVGEFPSAVRLRVSESGGDSYCGGTLIHRNLVITAAHCLTGALEVTVNFGSNQLDEQKEIDAASWCIHKRYEGTKKRIVYDLGMVKLARNLDYVRGRLEPACLKINKQHNSGAVCALTGFGLIDSSRLPDRLMTTSLMRNCDVFETKPSATCYSRPKPSEFGGVSYGDSGSGLYCFDNCKGVGQRSFLVGVNSVGEKIGCGSGRPRRCYNGLADLHGMSDEVMEMIDILVDGKGAGKHSCYSSI